MTIFVEEDKTCDCPDCNIAILNKAEIEKRRLDNPSFKKVGVYHEFEVTCPKCKKEYIALIEKARKKTQPPSNSCWVGSGPGNSRNGWGN